MVIKMEKSSIVFLDPAKYKSSIAPLAYFHDACSGCPYENDMSSLLTGRDRMDVCCYCVNEILKPNFSKGKPFEFNRETLEVKIK